MLSDLKHSHLTFICQSCLVDCLMCLNISLKKLQKYQSLPYPDQLPSSSYIDFLIFLFHTQYFCRYSHFHQFLLKFYSYENIYQSYNLTLYIQFAYFLVQICFFLPAMFVHWLRWHHIVLFLFLFHICVVLLFCNWSSCSTLIVDFLSILSLCWIAFFLVHLLVHAYIFYSLKNISP